MPPQISKPTWIDREVYTQLVQSQQPHCAHCKIDEGLLTVDHIVPRYSGGTDDLSNLQWLCVSCNSSKGERPDGYWAKPVYFDTRPDFARARAAQTQLFNLILTAPEFFGLPLSQINRRLYVNNWVTGAGKTLSMIFLAAALNHVARQMRGNAAPRVDRMLVLAKDISIRDQLADELREETVAFGLYPSKPRVRTIEDWRTVQSPEVLEQADIWVACLALVWDKTGGPTELERLRFLARFPLIHVDEPHWAAEQVSAIVREAWSSLCIGYTATPITGAGALLQQCVILSQFDYSDAAEQDSCVKYVAPTTAHLEPCIFTELEPNTYDQLRSGTVKTQQDVNQESDYSLNLRPALQVALKVVNVLATSDASQATNNERVLAPHRMTGTHVPQCTYPMHGLLVAETIAEAEAIATYLNQQFEARRADYPRTRGWCAEVVHSGEAVIGTKRRIQAKPLTTSHSWMSAKRTGEIDSRCSRLLVVVNMGREGMNNALCGVVGIACRTESQIELIQRVIGRQIRAVIRRHEDSPLMIDVPDAPFDQIRIISHKAYDIRPALEKAIDFVLHMRDKTEGLPTLEDIMTGELPHVAPGVDDDSFLTMRDKLDAMHKIGQEKTTGEEFDREIYIGGCFDDAQRQQRMRDWIDTIDNDPLKAWTTVARDHVTARGVVIREDIKVELSVEGRRQFLLMKDAAFARSLTPEQWATPSLIHLIEMLHREYHQQFLVGSLQVIESLQQIRNRFAFDVYSQVRQFLDENQPDVKETIWKSISRAVQDVLDVREKITGGGRYDRPEVHAILRRDEVRREVLAYVRTQLIRRGFLPTFEVFAPSEDHETVDV